MANIDDSPNVTITILPVSLSLVHIPRPRLKQFSYSIIQQILRPAPAFLNISCNATEVSIIAERDTVDPFVRASKRDWKRIEKRRRSQKGSDDSKRLEGRQRLEVQPVEVSSAWSALQIDSHGDQIDDASARIREISSLLSGISILYQSSYTTDFIFVNSRSLPKVIAILTEARFLRAPRLSSSFSRVRSSRPPYPSYTDSPSSSASSGFQSRERSNSYSRRDEEDIVDSLRADDVRGRRSRRDTTTTTMTDTTSSRTADSIHSEMSKLQLMGVEATPASSIVSPSTSEPILRPAERPYSFSPGQGPKVNVLPADLVVVGLSSDESDVWAAKLIRLLLFSEDVQAAMASYPYARMENKGAFEKTHAENPRPRGRKTKHRQLDDCDDDAAADDDSDVESFYSLDANDDDVFTSSSSSYDSSQSSSTSASLNRHSSTSLQPFFSLTRTSLNPISTQATSSSLTTDIHLLAFLFPPNERHWIFCGDEFERLERLDDDWEELEPVTDRRDDENEGGFLRCLHVDLQDFGLDRHGLISRFSALLHAEGIHHLYSSTFKTANLLVSERDSDRALKVLRGR
ncbi:hypothetical protein FRB95_003249 [Tulasnella sp. JGI-2019a]|nr:hypothetical protein FRB93_005163 [Tulasnella sp. JGI-2019a]KAG9031023.1 hypothetical protein FRB95_003249 [Tulasnella sp. JGI-2019a]